LWGTTYITASWGPGLFPPSGHPARAAAARARGPSSSVSQGLRRVHRGRGRGALAGARDTVWAMPTRLVHLVADANDPSRLARFWSGLLGWDIADETAEEVDVWPAGYTYPDPAAVPLVFVPVPEKKTAKNRVHLDLASTSAAHQAEQALAARLLAEGRAAIDRRDFTHAARWLEAAKGVAAAADIGAAQESLAAARREADADAWNSLLKNATDRLQQDRLIEPPEDNAKYYLLTLRGLDPGNPGLAAALSDLGARLAVKARRAISLAQYDAAKSWLDEAAAIGFASPDTLSARHDLDAALAAQAFLTNIVAAGELTLVKSVKPKYPPKAESGKVEGWVELDFTVAESGDVKDIAVHAASVSRVFDDAATSALSQWRFKPVIRDAKAVAQRARIRIRFTLSS